VLRAVGSRFQISADGRFGFLLDPEGISPDAVNDGPVFRAFDLKRLVTSALVKLPSDHLFAYGRDFTVGLDGSRIYLLGDPKFVRQVDVAAGAVSREIPTGWKSDEDAWIEDVCTAGRLHLLRPEGFGDTPDAAYWFDGERLTPGPASIRAAACAGPARFGVDWDARVLYRLSAGSRMVRVGPIGRPDAGADSAPLNAEALFATPDGSKLVLVLSDPELGTLD
jgi:hypothetical protein